MSKRKAKHLLSFVGVILLAVSWMILLTQHSPEEIIEWIGLTNAFLILFFLSVFGAVASMLPFAAYPAILGMANAGDSPLLIIAVAAVGTTLGDFLFVYWGRSAREVLPGKITEKVDRLFGWIVTKPLRFVQVAIVFWLGFLPLAHNLLTVPLAWTGFPVKKMAVPLLIGNAITPAFIVFLGFYQFVDFWS